MDRRDMLKTLGVGALAAGAVGIARAQSAADPADLGFDGSEFVLPDLPYAYDALEPYIDAQTMQLHHDIHHAGYVKGANAARAALAEIRAGARPASETKALERDLAFNGSGHALHLIFWNGMTPGGSEPSTELADALVREFGSVDAFKAQFTSAAGSVEGSGWGILSYLPLTGGLAILQAEKHQNLTFQGAVPLLAIDVWEHAYYLKYQNRRAEYITAWWNVANLGYASERYSRLVG